MDANVGINELEEMRQQVSLLKGKLEKEQIINEKLIRRSMYGKVSKVKQKSMLLCTVGLLNIPCSFYVFSKFGLSFAFSAVTALFLLVAVIYTMWSGNSVRADYLLDKDLLEQSRGIALLKRRNFLWLRFGIPFICIWAGWLATELAMKEWNEVTMGFVSGSFVGLVAGLILGIQNYRKTQRRLDEVLQQIEELTR